MMFRQVDQRHVSSEISLMEWSPTMDLIALATAQGEVLLHRLSWQKVWSLASPSTNDEEIKITSLVWRPDGKVLAIAYDTGKIVLVDVENAEVLHALVKNWVISSLHWVEGKSAAREDVSTVYSDHSALFLPKGYSLSKNYGFPNKQSEEDNDDCKKLCTEESMSILVFGTADGCVHLYAFGIFPCGCIKLAQRESESCRVLSAHLSEDMSVLTVFIETAIPDSKVTYWLKSFNAHVLRRKSQEYKVVALKYGQVSYLLACLQSTIHAIQEAWEDILLEIDTKLLNYAKEKKRVSEGTVSDDFLELLMFGTPSDALEKFLLHDLTENGLKKFGHSIELSYSNIQKLVLKKLQNVALSLYYYLSDLKGVSLWHEKFEELGLSFADVKAALSATGSFLMKATEVQQVIDNSMKNFKAFFRWLYAVILRLSDEPVPAEITKITQQDLNFVAEFLKENFSNDWDLENKSTFKLERVGQYLKDEDLQFPTNVVDNPWNDFLNKHPNVKEDDMIFTYFPENSLIQQFDAISKAIGEAFQGPQNVFPKYVSERNSVLLFEHDVAGTLPVSHSICVNDHVTSIFIKDCPPVSSMYIFRESVVNPSAIEASCLAITELPVSSTPNNSDLALDKRKSYKIYDCKFYNEDIVSALLIDNNMDCNKSDCRTLVQVPLSKMYAETKAVSSFTTGMCLHLEPVELRVDKTNFKKLENMKAVQIAVSGTRKVACFLFSSRRQVRLFETEVEDEDEDQEDTEHEDSIMKELSEKDLSLIDPNEVNNKENTLEPPTI